MRLKHLSFDQLVRQTAKMPADQAISTYKSWIALNPKSAQLPMARFQMGALYGAQCQWEASKACFEQVVKAVPSMALAWKNLGLVCESMGDIRASMMLWTDVVSRIERGELDKSMYTYALNHQALAFESASMWPEASIPLEKSFREDASQNDVLYHMIRMRQRLCDWPILRDKEGVSQERLLGNISALAMLSITDDPAEQLKASARTGAKFGNAIAPWALPAKAPGEKIRIGYASSNFGMHAVTFLMIDAIESHPREMFEVFAYCWSPEQNTAYRERVIKAFDHFLRVKDMSDEEVAKRIRDDRIDILVDLQGLTTGARPGIFRFRPAPIQIAYLGHPGSNAVPGVDHLIADEVLIGQGEEQHYAERVIRLGGCFQVNDRRRQVYPRGKKADFGFADNAYLLLAHNNTNKITDTMFSAWCDILQATDNSVLWVIADNQKAHENLQRALDARQIPAHRYKIDKNADYDTYMRRLGVGDLMLDTFPFNGGTTTSDALWMGLPVLTIRGRSFAARMSSSLLSDFGLQALVPPSVQAYTSLAISMVRRGQSARQLFEEALSIARNQQRYQERLLHYNRALYQCVAQPQA